MLTFDAKLLEKMSDQRSWQNLLNHHTLPLALFFILVMGIAFPYLGIPTYIFCALAAFIAACLLARNCDWISPAPLGMLLIAFSWVVNGYMKAKGMNTYLSWDEALRVPGYLLLWYYFQSVARPTPWANFFCLSLLGIGFLYLLFFAFEASRVPWDAVLYLIVLMMVFFKTRALLEEAVSGSGPTGRFLWVIGLLILWMGVLVKTPDELSLANVRQHSDSISFIGFLFVGIGIYTERRRLQTGVWLFVVEFASLIMAFAIGMIALYSSSKMIFTSWIVIGCLVILSSATGLLIAYQNRALVSEKELRNWLVRLDALSRFFLGDTHSLTMEGVFAILKQYLPDLAGLRFLDAATQIGTITPWQQTLMVEDRAIAILYFDNAEAAEMITPILPFLSNRLAQLVLQIRLSQEAVTDPLTGVCNRRALETLAPTFIAKLHEANHPLSVALVDLDFFKKVNDTYGHQVGDQVLVAFSQTLKKMLRAEDLIIRWGGEEFLLLLHGVTVFKAKAIIERIRQAFSQQKIDPVAWSITFSAGLAGGNVPNQNLFVQWTVQADEALYQAKAKGRNRVEIFQETENPNNRPSEKA